MTRRPRKYVLDSQLFIEGFRHRAGNEALQQFHRVFAPFEYLSVVVAQELRSGVQGTSDRRMLERHVLKIFERVGRVITPSARAWQSSSDVLGDMARREGLEVARVSKALGNDTLLALSCRESGCVLVTDNGRDFRRIRRSSNSSSYRLGRRRWPDSSRASRAKRASRSGSSTKASGSTLIATSRPS